MAKNSPSLAALKRAVKVAGSVSQLAALLGFTRQSVGQVIRGERPLPAEWCPKIEKATGIKRAELRPDLYT